MATFSSIFIPRGNETSSASLAATTSTAEIVLAKDTIFAVNATADINIKFGVSGMSAAASTDFRIPAGTTATFDLGYAYDRIRLYNAGAASLNYFILPLSRS